MENPTSIAIQAVIARVLRALVPVLLRHGVSFGVFSDIAKRIYVEVAMEQFPIPGKKQTVSRASTITGLSRKEVNRVRNLPDINDDRVLDRYNRAVRVISGWVRDQDFVGEGGLPADLPVDGPYKCFTTLVHKYSGDVPPRAILDELLRVGSVEVQPDGRYRLMSRAYIPAKGEDNRIAILGSEISDMIRTIDHNLTSPPEQSMFQLRVSYDNLPREALHSFQVRSSQRATELLELLDRELSAVDRDVNPDSTGTGQFRAGLSIFYFQEDISPQADEVRS